MSAFTRDEIIRKLVDQNVPRHLAERAAELELSQGRSPAPTMAATIVAEAKREVDRRLLPPELLAAREQKPAIVWPFRLLLPWSLLVSDNDREEPYIRQTENGPRPAKRKTARCAKAQGEIANLARGKLGDVEPAEIPLEITARVWVPNNQLRSDVQNFAKATHDALEGIVYRNDNLLYWNHWLRVGVDIDAPRAELTIAPLPLTDGG